MVTRSVASSMAGFNGAGKQPCQMPTLHEYLLELLKMFYKNSKDVGMAQKVQKQVKAATQWSINHGPYMQEWRTL